MMPSSLSTERLPRCLALCVMLRRWASLTAAAKKAYELRYKLLTYFYSSMYLAHKNGGTLARPIFFSDPSDLKARCAHPQPVETAHSF
jgi:alpha-glucosidase (family GH31 glycosyl hydrolase)